MRVPRAVQQSLTRMRHALACCIDKCEEGKCVGFPGPHGKSFCIALCSSMTAWALCGCGPWDTVAPRDSITE